MTPGSVHLPFSTFNIMIIFKLLLIPGALWDATPTRQMWRARHRGWGVLPEGSSLIPEFFVTVRGGGSRVAQPLQLWWWWAPLGCESLPLCHRSTEHEPCHLAGAQETFAGPQREVPGA